jgi:hypothetical protein|tara:strand:- start:5390 stop:5554 length:165 start_codon:yes stop_codon:yes gene_type:complete
MFADGRKVPASLECESDSLHDCDEEIILVYLNNLPEAFKMHFLQVQTPLGLFSN